MGFLEGFPLGIFFFVGDLNLSKISHTIFMPLNEFLEEGNLLFIIFGPVRTFTNKMILATNEACVLAVPDFSFQEEDLVVAQSCLRVGPPADLVDGVVCHKFFDPHVFFFAEEAFDDCEESFDAMHGSPLCAFSFIIFMISQPSGYILGPANIKAIAFELEYIDVLLPALL